MKILKKIIGYYYAKLPESIWFGKINPYCVGIEFSIITIFMYLLPVLDFVLNTMKVEEESRVCYIRLYFILGLLSTIIGYCIGYLLKDTYFKLKEENKEKNPIWAYIIYIGSFIYVILYFI